MRSLKIMNHTGINKQGESNTKIRVKMLDDNGYPTVQPTDKAVWKVGTNDAFLRDVDADVVTGTSTVYLDTASLKDLPKGVYQCELWITHKDGTVSEFPSKDELEITIDKSIAGLDHQAITTITLENLKDQIDQKLAGIKKDVQENAVKGDPGEAASVTIESTETGEPDTQASVVNTGDSHNAKLKFTIPRGDKGDKGDTGPAPKLSFPPVKTLPAGQSARVETKDLGNGEISVQLYIPAGPKGETGGDNKVINASVTMGEFKIVDSDAQATASLVKTGEASYTLNISVPRGPKGDPGEPGKDGHTPSISVDSSTYQLVVDGKTVGSSLRGPKGDTPEMKELANGNIAVNGTDTGVPVGKRIVTMKKAEYDALLTKDGDTIYYLPDADPENVNADLSKYALKTDVTNDIQAATKNLPTKTDLTAATAGFVQQTDVNNAITAATASLVSSDSMNKALQKYATQDWTTEQLKALPSLTDAVKKEVKDDIYNGKW